MKTAEEFNNEIKSIPNSDLCRKADEIISKLCNSGGKSFTMAVPPRIDDPDIVLSEVVRRLQAITYHPTTLPSDEEIEAFVAQQPISEMSIEYRRNLITLGAKWMRSLCEAKIAEMEMEMKESEISEDLLEIINVIQRTKDLYKDSRYSLSDRELESITELVDNYRRK